MSITTKSELVFERFLKNNDILFEKLAEAATPRPDYLIYIGNIKLIFEVKELAVDNKYGVIIDPAIPTMKSSSRTVGDYVRKRINDSTQQIKYGTNQLIPSILLIYNNLDPVFQMFGTEDHDFIAAMYGEYTLHIDKNTMITSDCFNGKNQLLQDNKNTSFSAIAHLSDRINKDGENINSIKLFENVFAKVKVPYEQLPDCFDLKRIIL
jgi:hypothetical protein